MLSREALVSALPLATLLDARRLTIQPIENTPLAALVGATRSDENFVFQNVDEYTVDIDTIEYIANKRDANTQASPHDMVMDDIVPNCIKAVQEHLYFAKNVVAPAVGELVQKTTETLNGLTPSSLLGMEVVTWNPPKPLLTGGFEAAVHKFEEVPFDVPGLTMNLPTITAQEMVELLHMGSSGLDKAIDEWVAEKGEGFFINLWENIFQLKQAPLNESAAPTFRDFTEDREQGVENALAIFLWARRLVEEPLPGTEMPLKGFTELCTDYRNQAGARLCRALNDLDQSLKAKTLVRSASGSRIIVNGPVYATWIEQGGDNEVLFGNLLEGSQLATVDAITAAAERLKSAWNRHAAITATVESNRRFGRLKEILSRHFAQMMREVTEGEEATLANRETVVRLFQEQLDRITEADTKDLWMLCLKLVCRSRFFRTDAEQILGGIEEARRQNPNLDIREAAAISTLKYIARWVASFYRVVPV